MHSIVYVDNPQVCMTEVYNMDEEASKYGCGWQCTGLILWDQIVWC